MSVLLCLGGALEVEVVRHLSEFSPPIDVARRCADFAEVIAAAEAGIGSIAVLHEWDLEFSERLHRCGVVIVGVDQSEDPNLDPRRRGCDALASPFAGDIAGCVRSLVELMARGGTMHFAADPVNSLPVDPFVGEDGENKTAGEGDLKAIGGSEGGYGQLIAVWGSPGSPGRSTLARDLACVIAQRESVLLVDADTYAPCLSQLLGVESETSAIIGVARKLRRGDGGDVMGEYVERVRGFDFLAGLNRGSRWREIPAAVTREMWKRVRSGWQNVVVDCSAQYELTSGNLERNAVTQSILEYADVILCVGQASPVGIRRMLAFAEEYERSGGARPLPVISKAPPSLSNARADIAAVLKERGMADVEWIRSCPGEYAKAEFLGVPLVAASPRCAAARDVAALAERLLGKTA